MADEIRSEFPDAEIAMIPSKGGRFEVMRDSDLIFSKVQVGRHAKPGEVMALLKG